MARTKTSNPGKAPGGKVPRKQIVKPGVGCGLGLKRPWNWKQLMAAQNTGAARKETVVPKKRKTKRGLKALKEIIKYQKSTEFLIPKTSFARLVREIANERKPGVRFLQAAASCLQEEAENYLVQYLEAANSAAHHAKRVTVMQKDMDYVKKVGRIMNWSYHTA